MPCRAGLDDIWACALDLGALRRLRQGLPVAAATSTPGTYVLLDGEAAFGIGEMKMDQMLWPRRVFNL